MTTPVGFVKPVIQTATHLIQPTLNQATHFAPALAEAPQAFSNPVIKEFIHSALAKSDAFLQNIPFAGTPYRLVKAVLHYPLVLAKALLSKAYGFAKNFIASKTAVTA